MLDKVNIKLLNERLNSFYSQRETTLKNIESCKKDLEQETDPLYNKIYINHKKYLNQINESINNLEQLINVNLDFFKNQKLIIATSNQSKLNEIKRILPEVESLPFAKDIEEVDGTINEVILHKAKDARIQNLIPIGTSIIVEDTIIRNLDTGKDITDIKWNVDSLKEGTNVEWITSLALNDGLNIYVFRGKQQGVITRERGNEGFAFDPYFIPVELFQDYNKDFTRNNINYGKLYPNHTLAELDKIGLKDIFSARSKALNCLAEFRLEFITKLVSIKEWEGKYQNEKEFVINYDDFVLPFDSFSHFKRFMIEEKIELSYNDEEEIKKLIKESKEIFITKDPYNQDMYGEDTIIIADSKGALEHNLEQSFGDI